MSHNHARSRSNRIVLPGSSKGRKGRNGKGERRRTIKKPRPQTGSRALHVSGNRETYFS